MDFSTFAVSELDRLRILYRVCRNDIGIKCPNPNHGGYKLNCYISIQEHKLGFVNCYVCGYKGSWNTKLVPDLGVKAYDLKLIDPDTKLLALQKILDNMYRKSAPIELPIGIQSWKGTWRGLPEDFLCSFGAKLYYDVKYRVYRILFPIYYNPSILIGYVMLRLDQNIPINSYCLWVDDWDTASISCPKYTKGYAPVCTFMNSGFCTIGVTATTKIKSINSIGELSLKTLFPFKNHVNTAIIVEGLYDALRLRYYGLPAYSNLGIESWSSYKKTLFHSVGVTRIIIMFDGDDPGYDHARSIRRELKHEFNTTLVDLPIGYDPGTISLDHITKIHTLMENNNNSYYLLQ